MNHVEYNQKGKGEYIQSIKKTKLKWSSLPNSTAQNTKAKFLSMNSFDGRLRVKLVRTLYSTHVARHYIVLLQQTLSIYKIDATIRLRPVIIKSVLFCST